MSLLNSIVGLQRRTLQVAGGCHNCPRQKVDFVPATLKAGPVIFVGEAPGATEVSKQRAFTGKSGQYLRDLLEEFKVARPWSFTNTIHCRPPEFAPAKPKEISCCLSQFVLDEIKDYSIVVLVGKLPLQALFPKARADHFLGNFARHPDFPNQRFYTIYHPAYVLRNPHLEAQYRQQIERLGRVTRGKNFEPDFKVFTGSKALKLLKEFVQGPLLSFDVETTRLESWVRNGKIKSLAVSPDGKRVIAIHESEPYFKPALKLLANFIADPSKSIVGMNTAFDIDWVERETGIFAQCQVHDVAHQYYYHGQYKMASLKELVARELDGYRFLLHFPHTVQDDELLLKYNSEDVIYTLQLFLKAMKELPRNTRDLCVRVLGPVSVVLQKIHTGGIYVRNDYRLQKIDEYEDKRRATLRAWRDEDPEFIPTKHESGKGLLEYLFKIRKLPVLERTENSNAASTDASVLKQLERDGFTIVRHLLELRRIEKILSTYLIGYDKKKHIWPDSRIRSQYPLTWTDSGRTSSKSPNLQNIPRNKEIRALFGVPDGMLLMESDLSQIEFRIMVCLANDENGIQAYLRGEDAHTMTGRSIVASGLVNPTPAQIAAIVLTKEQRSQAKPVNFGFLYGAHWMMVQALVADDYGVIWSDREAEDFRNIFFETYPALPIFHEYSKKKLIRERGWFESVTGHRMFYKDWDHEDKKRADHAKRAALNAEAQGPAAQICFLIMSRTRQLLHERGFRTVKFVNHVHDSMMLEVPNPKWQDDVISIIEEAKSEAYEWVKKWFVVPLVMEHSVGTVWGQLKEIKL